MRLAGKVVVVTGAGSGLGQALALELLRRGARVAAVDLRSEGLQETMAKAGSLGEGLSLHPLDITDKEKVAALPEEVERVHGQVDGLINNAGIIQPFKRLLDLDEAAMERDIPNFPGKYSVKSYGARGDGSSGACCCSCGAWGSADEEALGLCCLRGSLAGGAAAAEPE